MTTEIADCSALENWATGNLRIESTLVPNAEGVGYGLVGI
jgi:hypothetical protein